MEYGMTLTVKILVLGRSSFQFSKLYENEVKHDKRNFKRGLGVAFEVKISVKLLEKPA